MGISLHGCVAVIAATLFCCAAAEAQNTAPSPVIPAPPGNAQQDLQQTDHALDPASGHHLVWDAGKKSWIDMQTGQALGFQGAVAKDGTVIPAPAPSVAKSGAKTQAKQDPADPERAYNSVTGQTLVWNRGQSVWFDAKSQKNVGFQGAFAPGTGPPGGGPGASPAIGMMYGAFAAGGSSDHNDSKDDKDKKLGSKDDKKGIGGDDRGGGGGVTIPLVIPVSPSGPPPLQPSGGHTVSGPPGPSMPPDPNGQPQTTGGQPPTTPPPGTQTAVAPSQRQPVTSPAVPTGPVCGPIVTEKVFATLAKMTRDFNARPGAKVGACHNLYGLTTYEDSWDILGLDPGTSPGASEEPGYRVDPNRTRRAGPPQATWDDKKEQWIRSDGGTFSPWLTGASKACAIPRPDDACAATVQFMGTCQHAQVVNYVMWGRVNKLCSFPLSKARAAVSARSFFGDDEMRDRQLAMTNIGYAANAADEVREGFLTTPSKFQKCELKCPVKLPANPPWSYRWIGFNATE
jgi:hypothetical protein